MEISTDTQKLIDPLQDQRKCFRLTAYACRLAIADRLNIMRFPPNSFNEIEVSVEVLESAGVQIKFQPNLFKNDLLPNNLRYQTTISAIAELRNKSNEVDELGFTRGSNFINLEPRDRYPLELSERIERWPTFWQLSEGQELDRINQLTHTARQLQNNVIPPLSDLLYLGHFSCAALNATDRFLNQIS